MSLDPITAGLDFGKTLIKRFFPDKEAQQKAEQELAVMAMNGELQTMMQGLQVIITEAKSEHWLTANWRPITMLTFVALIVAHWLGWTAPNLSEEQVLALLEIVKIGLGGYVIGRSAEKVVKEYKNGNSK